MSFQVGDKVVVKSLAEIKETLNIDNDFHYKWRGENFNIYFATEMEELCGLEVVISDYDEKENVYKIFDREGVEWWFVDAWLEEAKPKPEAIYVSSFDENEADVKETFLKEILSTSEAVENCTKCICDECPEPQDCVIFKIRDAIRTYQEKLGIKNEI